MGRGFGIGTLLGIPIRIDYSWLIVFAVLSGVLTAKLLEVLPGTALPVALMLGVLTALLFFGSVLIHELMHSVVARARGLPVSSITLFIFGGAAQLEDEPPSPGIEFEMAVVGPLTSFALAGVFLVLWVAVGGLRLSSGREPADYLWILTGGRAHSPAAAVMLYLAYINLFLAVFNLAPGLPLDGGRLLRAVIWHVTGNLHSATRVAAGMGQLLGYLLIGLGILSFLAGNLVGIWLAFIGLFLLGAAQQSYQQAVFRSMLTGVPVGALARREVVAVPPYLTVQSLVDDYLLRHSANVFPVVSEGRVLGTVGLNEVQQVPRDARSATPVDRIMQPIGEDEVVPNDLDAWDAVRRLGKSDCECLLLMDEDRLDGIVTRDSLLRWVHTQRQLQR